MCNNTGLKSLHGCLTPTPTKVEKLQRRELSIVGSCIHSDFIIAVIFTVHSAPLGFPACSW